MSTLCRACGAEVLAAAAFCHRCGQPITETAGVAAGSGPQETTGASMAAAMAPSPPAAEDDATATQRTLWEGGYSAKSLLGGWITAALVTIAAVILGAAFDTDKGLFLGLLSAALCFGGISLYVMYRKLNVHYQLTPRRFVHQAGLLRRATDHIEVIDVDDVAFSQGPIQRLVGVGTIKIMSSDTSHPELFLEGIDQVAHVANLIDEARRAERQHRGLFIEAV